MEECLKTLFDSVKIGSLAVKNRIVRSATYEKMADDKGHVTDRLVDVYRRLSGSAGLIIMSASYVTEEGNGLPLMLGVHDNSMIPGLAKIAEAVHSGGSKTFVQLVYAGTQASIGVTEKTFSPSGVADLVTGHAGREMSDDDIRSLVRSYADAARRSAAAGFDGVQIHAAHGYLLSQFLSPYQNRRTDRYGGSPENRSRIIADIIALIRKENPVIPIIVKINGSDQNSQGLAIEDCVEICRVLESAGLDGIEVSGGTAASKELGAIRGGIRTVADEGYFFNDALAIANEVSIPLISVGGFRSPDVMENLLNTTPVEMFSMSRPFLAEPDLVKRWESGDRKRAKCVSCNKCRADDGNYCTIFRQAV
jgi:2,4-dienoyl-CoA reductase-like NADH-dependent reductase (Old Yellow Enzyme family)